MDKASNKYDVKNERREINWSMVVPNIIASLFYIWERDWRNNYVEILDKKKGIIVKKFNYSVDYIGAKAQKKLIQEDLKNLSISEFDTKYIDEIPVFRLDDVIIRCILFVFAVLAIILILFIEFNLLKGTIFDV